MLDKLTSFLPTTEFQKRGKRVFIYKFFASTCVARKQSKHFFEMNTEHTNLEWGRGGKGH